MICFLLQGARVQDAPTTLMAYMLSDFYREGVCLDFPKGGTTAIVDALVRGVTKHEGCCLKLNTHVERVLVEGGRAVGVRTADGATLQARKAVISNADLWSTRKMVDPTTAPALAAELEARMARVQRCDSFLHLHLGIDATGLPTKPTEEVRHPKAALPTSSAAVPCLQCGGPLPCSFQRSGPACAAGRPVSTRLAIWYSSLSLRCWIPPLLLTAAMSCMHMCLPRSRTLLGRGWTAARQSTGG